MGERTDARARRGTLVGQVVDGHELLRVLAAGGMGEVYLARHLRLGVHRAIKVIRDNQRETAHATERFHLEAQVLSRLQHNSIVQIIEFGELPNGWPFLAMEYVDGPNLDQVIEASGPMALGPALEVLAQIAEALEYAHRQNVIHRDLKPANVLLRGGDIRQVKVIDFGLARTVSAGALHRLTAEGQMVGSPLYMAPEQADGQLDVTGAVDA
jgi:serine/threonine-protein kinase